MPGKLPSLRKLSSRQRSFCKRIAAGEEAEAVIPELYPRQYPALVLCRLMANERIAEFLSSAAEVSAKINRNVLLLRLGEILDDPKARPTNVLEAARLSSQLLGYVETPSKAKRRALS